jgi:FlaA1/EpsC-like NDP-sugar epimerase
MELMRRVLIYGAGEAGTMVLREIQKHPEEKIEVAGFIDDDIKKIGRFIQGIKVFCGKAKLGQCIKSLNIAEVIIAMPSIPKIVIKEIVRICKAEKVKLLIVPSTMEIIEGSVRFDQIKKLDLADLLDRDEVEVDADEIRQYIQGKRILVTGAAGSIGSQLLKDLLKYNPHTLIALDINENGLFYLSQNSKSSIKNKMDFILYVSDIKDNTY